MKQTSKGWRILSLPKDEQGRTLELECALTLGSATVSRMKARVLWWTPRGARRFLTSSTGSSRTS